MSAGIEGSPTFRALFDRLQRSDVVVYVEPDICSWTSDRACLLFVAKAGEVRYLRINVSFLRPQRQLVAQIGHEMRHAVEISENPAVVSAGTMKAFFERVGWYQCSGQCGYETKEAYDARRAIMKELGSAALSDPRPPAIR